MSRLARRLDAEIGPALLFDAEHRAQLAVLGELPSVGGPGVLEKRAEDGLFAFLRQSGTRDFSGKVVVIADEEVPAEWASRVEKIETGLLLRAPSGTVQLATLDEVDPEAGDLPSLSITPGTWLVELSSLVSREAELSGGEKPPSGVRNALTSVSALALGLVAVLGALAGAVFLIVAAVLAFTGEWGSSGFGLIMALVAFAPAAIGALVVFRPGERDAERKAIAALPDRPDYLVVLRPAPESAVARGGGLTD